MQVAGFITNILIVNQSLDDNGFLVSYLHFVLVSSTLQPIKCLEIFNTHSPHLKFLENSCLTSI